MRSRALRSRTTWVLSIAFVFPACSNDFDNTRVVPPRGTLGAELFGVVCDRVGAQALHEDMTGASFHAICHAAADGTYADQVDVTQLPPIVDGALDVNGNPVPAQVQQDNRNHAVARIQTLAARRSDLIQAFDATFPDIQVPIKDTGNADPTQSCNPPGAGQSGEDSLHSQLADMLGRFQALYNDGTIPQSTESLGRLMNAFKAAQDAQQSLARFDARHGYRPVEIALGAARPVIAYPKLRDLSNASLSLLSADSQPYQLNPQYDANGNPIPIPGAAYPQFSQLLQVAHEELRTYTADPAVAPLLPPVTDPAGRIDLSRPRTDLEVMQTLLYAQDPSFGSGTPSYIVKRDGRGYATVALVNGKVPAPFVDANNDGLADVDDLGQFVTSNNQPAPAPFLSPELADSAPRDSFGRALSGTGGALVYDYLDTSHTYTASLLSNLKPLVNPDPSQNHETMMYALAGAQVLFGTRDGTNASQRQYAPDPDLGPNPVVLQYDAFHADDSALLDLVYAFGQILGDPTADDTLGFAKSLVATQTAQVARLTGDALYLKNGVADQHPEAKIPPTSTLWDEVLDVSVPLEQEPGLLEDVLRALGDDRTLQLATSFSDYVDYNDRISYDRNNLNGPAYNFASSDNQEMHTAVDRTQADTGPNRSAFQKFLQAINDTDGVTACNKDQAVVHAAGLPLIGTADICSGALALCSLPGQNPFAECEVFKIDNLAKFYVDSIVGKANLYFRPDVLRNGIVGIGAATIDTIEQSSGIGLNANDFDGFWNATSSNNFQPRPQWLNRLVFFDIANDSPNPGDPNYLTNHFLADLQGSHIGTKACPERVINDPVPSAPDASPDGLVHGLRSCQDGDWFFQRDQDATFVWENFGFYTAITPLVTAFVNHGREDLFIQTMEVLNKHWQDGKGTADECNIGYDQNGNQQNCTKDGAVTYEPLLGQLFASDILPALHDLVKVLGTLQIPHCTATDPNTHQCTATTNVDGVTVLANATRALLDPTQALAAGLKDRHGNAAALRNDGTTNPQVTPIYLVLEALNNIDAAFAAYAKANPQDTQRQTQWRTARSQLVDQFLDVNGKNSATATFANASTPKILPTLIDLLRSQLVANCPDTFTPPNTRCAWARDTLTQKMSASVGGPTFAATMDLLDAVRQNDPARTQIEALLAYLVDAASNNDALAAALASTSDILQELSDDTNLTPLFHVLAQAAAQSTTDANGNVTKSLVDANFSLLARIAGKAYDANDNEICAEELDPNQVLTVALANVVTPMTGADGKPTSTPLEVIMDVIADVNRADPTPDATVKLQASDYQTIADNVSQFLLDQQRGLEQFYAVVRQGTVH
jgi:hypothetical protein